MLRSAEPHDGPVVARLHLDAAIAGYQHIFPPEAPVPTYEELLAHWSGWLEPTTPSRHVHALVAERDGRVTGAVVAGADASDPQLGHLSRLYVAPELWGQGIGGRLHSSALIHLRDQGYAEATLWVLERNDWARSWYERLGWSVTAERRPVYAPGGIDDVLYRIVL